MNQAADPLREGFRQALASAGALPVEAGQQRLTGQAGHADEGTVVRFELALADGRIQAAAFRVLGCPFTTVACLLVSRWLPGRSMEELAARGWEQALAPLNLPPERSGRLLLIEDALRKCLRDWDTSGLDSP